MVDAIFPDFTEDRQNSVILTSKNDTSLQLNDEILQRLPGAETEYFSCDKAVCDDEVEAQTKLPNRVPAFNNTNWNAST